LIERLENTLAAMSGKEIYVSTDVEADGPVPGPILMLSFGSAAYTGGKEFIGTFSANLETLPGAMADPNIALKSRVKLYGPRRLQRVSTDPVT